MAAVTEAAGEDSTSFVVDPGGQFYVQDQFAVYANGVRRSDNKVYGVDLSTLSVQAAIGRGASGIVRRAVHNPSGTLVALKEIPINDKNKRKHVVQELTALYDADCVSLIGFHGAFYAEGRITLCLEFMDGGSLEDLLAQVGPLPEPVIAAIAFQALHGLAYLRQGKRLHRDLKPSNILLNSAGWVRLTDFGVSADLASSLGAAHTVTGTVAFMSPERLQRQAYSFAADMWSFGLTLLQCAWGQLPYRAASAEPLTYVALTEAILHGAVPGLPAGYSAEMAAFLALVLSKEPEKRADARLLLSTLGLPWFAAHGIADLKTAVHTLKTFREEVAALVAALAAQQAAGAGADGKEAPPAAAAAVGGLSTAYAVGGGDAIPLDSSL